MRNRESVLLWFFCGLQLITWTLIPTFFRHNVPFDTIEGIAWGNQWMLGYDKHPPLAAWLSALATHIGGSVGWPVYLLGQLAVIATFLAVWQLAKKLLSKEHAILSVLLLFGVMYYSSPSITIKFNPTTLMSPIWALSILVFYNAITKNLIRNWLLLGICAALSILTKYESAILLFCMVITMLATNEGREKFKTFGPYLAGLICLIMLTPHLIWLIKDNFTAITYANTSLHLHQKTMLSQHITFPLKFFFSQVVSNLPMLLLAIPLFRTDKVAIKTNQFIKFFLLIMGFGPLVLTMTISVVTGCYLYAKWATPFFSLNGILLISFLRPKINEKVLKQFIIILLILFISLGLVRISYTHLSPKLNLHHIPDDFFPGQEIAQNLTAKWHNKYHSNLTYIAGDHYLAANISVYSNDHPIPYLNWSKKESPWIDEQALNKYGAIFVWRINPNGDNNKTRSYRDLKCHFPKLGALTQQSFPQSNNKVPPVEIAVAILPPEPAVIPAQAGIQS